MSSTATSDLERLLRKCDLGWMIDWHKPPDRAVPLLHNTLERATQESKRRFGPQGPAFSEQALARVYSGNPHKVRAFLQALGATGNAQMLVMAWRILQGAAVDKLHIDYEDQKCFQMCVVLVSPYGEADKPYESNDVSDVALLRHFGIATIDGKPLLNGFYPLQVP